VVIHYEEALYQVYAPLPLPLTTPAAVAKILFDRNADARSVCLC